jgi:hypothetical protein
MQTSIVWSRQEPLQFKVIEPCRQDPLNVSDIKAEHSYGVQCITKTFLNWKFNAAFAIHIEIRQRYCFRNFKKTIMIILYSRIYFHINRKLHEEL